MDCESFSDLDSGRESVENPQTNSHLQCHPESQRKARVADVLTEFSTSMSLLVVSAPVDTEGPTPRHIGSHKFLEISSRLHLMSAKIIQHTLQRIPLG